MKIQYLSIVMIITGNSLLHTCPTCRITDTSPVFFSEEFEKSPPVNLDALYQQVLQEDPQDEHTTQETS